MKSTWESFQLPITPAHLSLIFVNCFLFGIYIATGSEPFYAFYFVWTFITVSTLVDAGVFD